MTLNLYYWPLRGLNESVVTLLEYSGVEYQHHKINTSEEWVTRKQELVSKGFDFPNLPYIEHQGKFLSESLAIMVYIAKTFGNQSLLPTVDEMARFVQLNGVVTDINSVMVTHSYGSSSLEALKANLATALQRHAPKFPALLKLVSSQQWLLGDDRLTVLDFKFAELLEKLRDQDIEIGLGGYGVEMKGFDQYLERFLALPKVKEYRASSRFQARPYNGDEAVWK